VFSSSILIGLPSDASRPITWSLHQFACKQTSSSAGPLALLLSLVTFLVVSDNTKRLLLQCSSIPIFEGSSFQPLSSRLVDIPPVSSTKPSIRQSSCESASAGPSAALSFGRSLTHCAFEALVWSSLLNPSEGYLQAALRLVPRTRHLLRRRQTAKWQRCRLAKHP
jgi:hypothetical protein